MNRLSSAMMPSLIRRSSLLMTALIVLIVAAIGLAVLGISWINVDKLHRWPVTFTFFFIVPPVVATLCLILAALPRIAQINLVVFLCLLLSVEVITGVLNLYTPQIHGD